MTDKPNTFGWQHTGQKRPDFALEPGPCEESVWDYPRPPAIVDDSRDVQVFAADGTLVAACNNSKRVLETAAVRQRFICHPMRSTCRWRR